MVLNVHPIIPQRLLAAGNRKNQRLYLKHPASAVPTFMQLSKLDYSGGRTTSTVPAFNLSPAINDLILLHMLLENGPADISTKPPGFSRILGQYADSTGSPANGVNSRNALYWKLATGSESSFGFTHTSAATEITALDYGNVDVLNPFDSVTPSANRGSGSTATASPLTTLSPNDLLVFLGSMWSGWNENVTPSGYTQRSWLSQRGLMAADFLQAAAGLSGSPSAASSTNDSTMGWAIFLAALKATTGATRFPFNKDPDSALQDDRPGGAGLTVGILMNTLRAGISAKGIRWWAPAGSAGAQYTPYLFDGGGTQLATGPAVTTASDGYNYLPFTSPVTLINGSDVIAATFMPSTSALYSALTDPWQNDYSNSDFKILGSSANGGQSRYVYSSTPALSAASAGSKAWYGMELVYA